MNVDKELKNLLPSDMFDGAKVRIELVCGFEKFNDRPYHCYETWCQGWRITGLYGKAEGVTVEREMFEDAVSVFLQRVREKA